MGIEGRKGDVHEVLCLVIVKISLHAWYDCSHRFYCSTLRYVDYVWWEAIWFPHFPVEEPGYFAGVDSFFVEREVSWVEV